MDSYQSMQFFPHLYYDNHFLKSNLQPQVLEHFFVELYMWA